MRAYIRGGGDRNGGVKAMMEPKGETLLLKGVLKMTLEDWACSFLLTPCAGYEYNSLWDSLGVGRYLGVKGVVWGTKRRTRRDWAAQTGRQLEVVVLFDALFLQVAYTNSLLLVWSFGSQCVLPWSWG